MVFRAMKLSEEGKASVSGIFVSWTGLIFISLGMLISGFFINALIIGFSDNKKTVVNSPEKPARSTSASVLADKKQFPDLERSIIRDFIKAQEQSDHLKVLEIASSAANAFPESALPYVYKAQALLKLGRLAEANATIINTLRRYPDEPSIHLAAAAFFQATKNPVAAEKMLFKTLQLDPENVGAFRALAATYLNAGLYLLAKETASNGLSKNPSDPDLVHAIADALRLLGNYSEAAKKYGQYVLISPETSASTFYFLATCQRLSGVSAPEVSGNYRRAIEKKADFLPAINDFALHLASNGNASEALELTKKLEKFAPDSPGALDTRGIIYFKANRLEDAEKAFLKARTKDPENPDISAHLAAFYLSTDKQELYSSYYQEAINKSRGDLILLNRIKNEIRIFEK